MNKRYISKTGMIEKYWYHLWKGKPPGILLFLTGMGTALLMTIPILYVSVQSFLAGIHRWQRLLDRRIPELLYNTLTLAFAVTFFAVLTGIFLAWIVERTDIPGRKIWRWLLVLPMVIPPYVGAVTYIITLGRSGWAKDIWESSRILSSFSQKFPLDIYSFWGVVFVLTMFTYPYVYLIVSGSIKKTNRNYEEAAKSKGLSAFEIFFKVNLPLMKPAIGAGAVLVFLYVLSDFGAVSMLRYVTFTAAIYFQRVGFDTSSASVLSVILIIITIIVLLIEGRTTGKRKYYQTANSFRKPQILDLGKFKIPSIFLVTLIFLLSTLVPLSVLIYWAFRGLNTGAINMKFIGYTINTLTLALFTAIISSIFSLPVVYLKSRHKSLPSSIIEKMSYIGYTLPGVIVALGFIFIFNNYFTFIYATPLILVLAFFVRFFPQSLQAGQSSINQISPKIDEAARSLGTPPWKILYKIILPNMIPGILSGAALVFVSSVKELPVTLMLRAPGFDTLAVRVYFEAHDGIYHLAAPGALLIILVSILPLRYMMNKY